MAQGRPDNIDPKIWEEAVRKAIDLKSEMKEVDGVLDSIAQKVTGLGVDVWYDNIRKSSAQIRLDQEELNKIQAELVQTQTVFNEKLEDKLNNTQNLTELNQVLSVQGNDSNFILALQNSEYNGLLEKAGSLTDVKNFLNDLQSNQLDLTQQINVELGDALLQNRGIAHELDDQRDALSEVVDKYAEAEAEAQKLEKTGLSFGKGIKAYSKLFGKQVVDFMFEYDAAISKAQADTGMFLKDNESGMGSLVSSSRAFGMSVQDNVELLGGLGEQLRTTNENMLTSAAKDFAPLQKAIGVSVDEIGTMAGEMMRFGQSSQDVRAYYEDINKESHMLGVNTRNVVRQITQNIGKMRQFGFTEGEESLKRMASRAELLRVDVSEIFNVAEQARTLEGALEMAAELQLAGGSFSNINPMDLLSAARNSPEELEKILTTMGKDVGKFNEKTGKYEFNQIDTDRLQIVAKATGLRMDFIQNSIAKNAEMAKKTDMFGNMFSGMDKAEAELKKSALAEMLNIGEKGQIGISDKFKDIFEEAGITDLATAGKEDIAKLLKIHEEDTENLEERAKLNQGLEESFKNLVGGFQATLSFLEPTMKWLAEGFSTFGLWVGNFEDSTKKMIAGFIGGIYLFNKGWKLLGKGSIFKNIAKRVTGGGADETANQVGNAGQGGGLGDRLKTLGAGLKEMAGKEVRSGILNTALFAPTGILALGAVPFLTFLGKVSLDKLEDNFTGLGEGLKAMNNTKSGIGALALLAPAGIIANIAIPFLTFMGKVSLDKLEDNFTGLGSGLEAMGDTYKGVGALALFAPVGVIANFAIPFLTFMGLVPLKSLESNFTALGTGLQAMSKTFVGSAALAAFGIAGLIAIPSLIFLKGIAVIGKPAKVGLKALGQGLASLGGAAIPLGFIGVGLIAALGLAMIPFGYALSLTAPLVEAFGNIIIGVFGVMPAIIGAVADGFVKVFDVMTMENVGAMYMMSGAMLSMGIASMAFANPLSVLGMLAMTGNLALLAAVMIPLSKSLTIGADGMERFASAIGELKSAVSGIDVSKLEQIQETASNMAEASRGSAMDKLASTVQNLLGGGGSKNGKNVMEHKIALEVYMDGKKMQSKILRDTSTMVGR